MIRFIVGLVVLVGLAVVALLVAPAFVDLNPYKDRIAAEVSKATGRTLAIDGGISLRLLPTPRVTLGGVRVGNIEGALASDMATIESLDATVAFGPLLGGEVKVTSITLIGPVVTLERLADGRANWELSAEPGDGSGDTAISFDSVRIERGTLVYRDAASGDSFQADAIELDAKAASLSGPFEAEGRAIIADLALGFRARVGALGRESVPVTVELDLGEAQRVAFSGAVGGLDTSPEVGGPEVGGPEVSGEVSAGGPSLSALLAVAGVAVPAMLDQPYTLAARVTASAATASLSDVTAALGETRLTGALTVEPGTPMRLDGILVVNRIDLDRLLAAAPAAEAPGTATGPLVPAGFAGHLSLSVDALVVHAEIVQQVRLDLGFDAGAVTIEQGTALLPGASDLALFGTAARTADGPRFDGQVEIASDNLRALLAWAGIAAESVPADRLRHFGLATQVSATPSEVALDGLDLRIDTTRVTGSVTTTLGAVPAINADLALDKLNVDAYLPAESAGAGGGPPVLPTGFALDLTLAAEQLTVRGQGVRGLALAARLADGRLALSRLRAEDLAGVAVAFDGELDPLAPRYDGTLRLEGASIAGLARLAALDPTWRLDELGRVSLEATLAGDAKATRFDANVATVPFDAKVGGTIDVATLAMDVSYDATVRDAARALGAFAVAAELPDTGPLRLTGTYKGSPDGGDAKLAASGGFGAVEVAGRVGLSAFDVGFKASGASRNAALALFGVAPDMADGDFALEGTAKGGASEAAVDVRGSTAGATLALNAVAKGLDTRAAYTGRLSLDHPDMDGFLAAIGRPGLGAPGPLKVDLALAGDDASLRSESLSATFGPASVNGTASARLDGPVPSVDLALNAGDLVLDPFLGGTDGGTESAERWSTEPLDLAGLRDVDGHLLLNATSATLGALRLDNAVIEATLSAGVLRLDRLAGGLFGGSLAATGRLATGELNGLDLNLALADVDAYQALAATADYRDLRGRLDLDGRFDSLGASEADLVGNLAGDARVALRDGVIDGYDLTAINQRLMRLDTLIDFGALLGTSLQGGSTPIRQAGGTFVVERGVARSTDLGATMDGAIATGEAVIDLPRWYLLVKGRAELQGHQDAPPIGMKMEGPLDAPETTFNTEKLQAFVAQRVVGAAIQQFGDQGTQTLFGIITGQPTSGSQTTEPQPLEPQPFEPLFGEPLFGEPLFGEPQDTGELPLPATPDTTTSQDSGELPEPALPQPGQQGTTTDEQLLQDLLQGVLGD